VPEVAVSALFKSFLTRQHAMGRLDQQSLDGTASFLYHIAMSPRVLLVAW
jgi:hypothetical protein